MGLTKRTTEELRKPLRDAADEATPHSTRSSGLRANLETLALDLRFSLRTLARDRGFTTVAVLTLALGIGANTAMFSVVQGLILAPLPFPEADRVAFVWQNRPGVPQIDASYPNFVDWERTSRSFDSMAALDFDSFNLTSPGSAEHLVGIRALLPFWQPWASGQSSVGTLIRLRTR